MGCFVVAEFLLTSALRSPSAIAEPLVCVAIYVKWHKAAMFMSCLWSLMTQMTATASASICVTRQLSFILFYPWFGELGMAPWPLFRPPLSKRSGGAS